MIEFTRDYRGWATENRFHRKGEQTDEYDAETEEYLCGEANAAERVGGASVIEDDIVELDSSQLPDDFPAREALIGAGLDSVEAVNGATDDEITAINGIGSGKLASIRAAIEAL